MGKPLLPHHHAVKLLRGIGGGNIYELAVAIGKHQIGQHYPSRSEVGGGLDLNGGSGKTGNGDYW